MEKAAVIGFGNVALRHRKNLKILFPDVEVFGMSASGRTLTETVDAVDRIFTNIGDLILAQPDIVIVASPSTFHAQHVVELIKNNIAVLVEKPLAATTGQCKSIIEAAAGRGSMVAIGYCLRYLSSASRMKDLIEERAIGEIYNTFATVGQYLPSWRTDVDYKRTVTARKELGGGVLLELSHELDYLFWLLGELSFQHAILRGSSELDIDVEQIADIVCHSEVGGVCNIHMDFLQKHAHRQCSFVGSKGRLDWNLIENSITLSNENGVSVVFCEPDWDRNNMYLELLLDFLGRVSGNRNRCASPTEGLKVVRLVEEIKYKAARSKSA